MKILHCQIQPKTGALKTNVSLIKKCYHDAKLALADICVLPELSICGYFAEDLFLNDQFINDIWQYVNELVRSTTSTCLLIPAPILKDNKLYNAVIAARNGKIIGQTYKHNLPNYGVFDENRYFSSGLPEVFVIDGFKFAVPICEDVWSPEICNDLKLQGAEMFIVVNASPFEKGKLDQRINCVKKIFNATKIPLIYCNQVASQDGITFDGNSFCFDGELNFIGKSFESDCQILEFKEGKFSTNISYVKEDNQNEEIYRAMVFSLRSYVHDNGFSSVVLGLSGGLDSAMVASIAVDALGADSVSAFMLPSKITSIEAKKDAINLANCLNIDLKTISISDVVNSLAQAVGEGKDLDESSIIYQNLQSRARGVILMAKSNETGSLLLTTGNKSEYATGYATIYGDMNGAFNPIKDLYKTELYEIARYKKIIPENILSKAPSAELVPNQKDSDSLPEYETLDQILQKHIECDYSEKKLSKEFDSVLVSRIIKLVKNSEFKRRQSAAGVKISSKNLEKDRRMPITNHY